MLFELFAGYYKAKMHLSDKTTMSHTGSSSKPSKITVMTSVMIPMNKLPDESTTNAVDGTSKRYANG